MLTNETTGLPAVGATAGEWARAAAAFSPRILPCVCDPDATPARKSLLKAGSAAKVPSQMRGPRQFTGIPRWTSRPPASAADIALWKSRPEHGILCRTGSLEGDGVLYALDADVEDETDARAVLSTALGVLGLSVLPVRSRGSARWACLLREPGRGASPKRIIPMASGSVEILGRGGQLAVAGTHPSGQRYRWSSRSADGTSEALSGPAVVDVPVGAVDRLVEALSAIATGAAAADADRPARELGESYAAADPLADWLKSSPTVDVVAVHPDGRIDIRCPWRAEHTGAGDADKPQDATYFPAGLHGYAHGGFRCLHAHSGGGGRERTAADLAAWARDHGWAGAVPDGVLPDLTAAAPAALPPPPPDGALGLEELGARLDVAGWRGDDGSIAPTADSVTLACMCPALIGQDVRRDDFLAMQMAKPYGRPEVPWAPLDSATVTDMRCRLERYGFRPRGLTFDLIDRCLELASIRRRMDSMLDHLAGYVPAWDGQARWRTFFRDFCHAEEDDADYLAALGAYLGAALWARASCTSPDGVKADIVPVLIGPQGTRKSTLVGVLAMDERWTADLNLESSDVEVARLMRGRLTIEVPELVGFGKRAEAAVKALVSQAYDDVRPLYRARYERHPRRCLLMMTTNERAFLSDPTGNRRFAPVHVSAAIDIDGVRAVLPQLWSEGRELARDAAPLERMRLVEALADTATESATVRTDVDDLIAAQVARLKAAEAQPGYCRPPLTMDLIMREWLGWPRAYKQGGAARDVGGRLQRAGMISVRRLVPAPGGGTVRMSVWELAGCGPIEYTLPAADLASDPFAG